MGSVLQRDAVRTKRALLDAAARTIAQHGPGVSLEAVAREAGVSKGGLLHHFRTKESLLIGLFEEWIAQFDEAVARQLTDEDTRPGRMCRAHIRAAFDDESVDTPDQLALWRQPSVMMALMALPEILRRAQESDRRWRADLARDGLHAQRILLITSLLDGVAMAEMFSSQRSDKELAETRALLLALTENTGPLVEV